jgi:gluconokinase
MTAVVVMGVAGCGKSSLGQALAQARGWAYIEGDAFHPPNSIDKMRAGIALTDEDRAGWLDTLGGELQKHPQGVVLACSALKRAYRERLRAARPGLRFVFLEISRELSLERVAARAAQHFFTATLVDSQFAALESPVGEPGVVAVAAALSPEQQLTQAQAWLEGDGA